MEQISVKGGHMKSVANAAMYLEIFNELELKLSNTQNVTQLGDSNRISEPQITRHRECALW
jgi:hypothetical protein